MQAIAGEPGVATGSTTHRTAEAHPIRTSRRRTSMAARLAVHRRPHVRTARASRQVARSPVGTSVERPVVVAEAPQPERWIAAQEVGVEAREQAQEQAAIVQARVGEAIALATEALVAPKAAAATVSAAAAATQAAVGRRPAAHAARPAWAVPAAVAVVPAVVAAVAGGRGSHG